MISTYELWKPTYEIGVDADDSVDEGGVLERHALVCLITGLILGPASESIGVCDFDNSCCIEYLII